MAKEIIKEIIIMLLLCLAIILVLGVLLYDYVPTNKVIPEKVAYTTPENVKEELNKTQGVDETQVVLTYEVDESDLKNYKRVNDYVPGKQNPFSASSSSDSDSEDSTGVTTTSGSNSSTNTDIVNNSSEGTYLPNNGTK